MFKNTQAYIKTFGFIIPISWIIILNLNYLIYFPLIYYSFILIFIYYLFNNKNKIVKIKFETQGIIKDKEFILFKNNLFNLYYSL